MIRNPSGEIAIKWMINPNGKTVRMGETDQYYVFTPKFHVVMAWVKSEHVDVLLSKKEKTCNCNNGTFKNAFAIASLLDVNLWETGTRHGEGHEVTWEEVKDG
jgi:hypothetical protein